MNKKGRVENTIKNSTSVIVVQILSTIMGLVARTFFIHYLSAEYLGVNGLFSNILTMLSLAEMGIGAAITFSMYKPIAHNDERKIAQLLNLYKKTYRVIGAVIFVIGLCIIPFLGIIIKEKPDIDHLTLIYVMFLSNTAASYLFAYKKSLLTADQLQRIVQFFALGFQFIRYTLQIIVLVLFSNFILYLAVQILCTLLENIVVSIYVDERYPFLKRYRREELNSEDKLVIYDNVKALFIYKLGGTALDGTDNIIISAFDGVISVGLLSNYSLITSSLQSMLYKITNAITGSVGNYLAKEDSSQHEKLLNNISFLHFLLYGLVFVGCMSVLQPFVVLWAGKDYLLSYHIVFIHCLNIYIYGMMNSIWMFRTTMGLFIYGKWRPLVSAIINVIVSVLLARKIGLLGVLLGTTITRLITNVWYDPYIVYKHGLKKSPFSYYGKWTIYLLHVLFNIVINAFIQRSIVFSGIIAIFAYGGISVIMFCATVVLCFGKTEEYQYFKDVFRRIIGRIVSARYSSHLRHK